jgi:hypothetical protein
MRMLGVIGVALLAACGGIVTTSGGRPSEVQDAPVRVLGQFQQAEWSEPDTVEIGNADAWRDAWARLQGGVTPLPPAPSVDFATERVIIVAAGMRPSGGFGYTFDRSRPTTQAVEVGLAFVSPGPRCSVAQMLTAPAIALAIPRVPAMLRLTVASRVQDCEQ